MKRNNKLVLFASAAALVLVIVLIGWVQQEETETVVVYKSPTCGCCGKWVDHMREAGFEVEVHDLDNLSTVKATHGVLPKVASCHTALVGGYVVEGHVPATYVKKLLEERPAVTGIAVPGMPMGSPGMEGPTSVDYDVLTFDKTGKTAVFAHVKAQ
ncbi:MAG: DUF411 domain-containing protein [Rhodothermales bacterium]